MVNLRRLKYFVTLAEEKNFTSAANILYISQPTLSQEIMKMEKEYGFKLFVRSSRTVTLTKEGARLMPEAEAILLKADKINQLIASLKQEQMNTREFVIALDVGWSQFEYIGVTKIIKELREDFPSIVVKLNPFHYPESLQELEDGSMQAAILYMTENLLESFKYSYRVIDSANMCLAVPAELLKKDPQPDIGKILQDNTMLALTSDEDYMYGVTQLYRKYGKRPNCMEVHDMTLMMEYVAAGGGIALIPKSYAETLKSRHIGIADLGEHGPVGYLIVAWNHDRMRRNATLKAFINKLVVEDDEAN